MFGGNQNNQSQNVNNNNMMFNFTNQTQNSPSQPQNNIGGFNFVQQQQQNNMFNVMGNQNAMNLNPNFVNLNQQFNNMNLQPNNNIGGFYNMNNMNMGFQQTQNISPFQQNVQNSNQFKFNVNQNTNVDDEFKEVEEDDNTKKPPVVENKSGLSNLLDSKLVNLDSLKGSGKSTNPNSMNYSGISSNNINNYNFY